MSLGLLNWVECFRFYFKFILSSISDDCANAVDIVIVQKTLMPSCEKHPMLNATNISLCLYLFLVCNSIIKSWTSIAFTHYNSDYMTK